ncbi:MULTISPECIES: antitoxin [unclassified Streptomyces]|uniref:antitoxin n=1 Tax=unclassified Streptomyces TaxID=2593676 RepID=UPI0033D85BD2
MGLLDNMKARIGPAKEKVSDLAQRHGGTIGQNLDKAAKVVDEKTKGKYSDRIHAGTGKAKHAMDRLAHKGGTGPETRTAPEPGTSPDPGTGTAPGGAAAPTPPEGPPPTS